MTIRTRAAFAACLFAGIVAAEGTAAHYPSSGDDYGITVEGAGGNSVRIVPSHAFAHQRYGASFAYDWSVRLGPVREGFSSAPGQEEIDIDVAELRLTVPVATTAGWSYESGMGVPGGLALCPPGWKPPEGR